MNMNTTKRLYLTIAKTVYLKPDFSRFDPVTGKVPVDEITANLPLDVDVSAVTQNVIAEFLGIQPVQVKSFSAEKRAVTFDYSKLCANLPCLVSIDKVAERKTE